MERLFPFTDEECIPTAYRDTPIGDLVRFHELGMEPAPYDQPELLVGMCMDHRKKLRIPENFAFVLRAGGANLRASEFKVSFAIALGGIQSIALIAHSRCGMVNMAARREEFVGGLVERGGWSRELAAEHFDAYAPLFEIGNAIDFVLVETDRLRRRYPRVTVAPLFYEVDDGRLYGVRES